MEHKDWSKELMAYLYEEMNEQEKQQFEKVLTVNPTLRKELDSLKNVRKELLNIKDKEVVEPLTHSEYDRSVPWTLGISQNRSSILRSVVGIAAALIFLMTAGYLTQFQLKYQEGTFAIGFNRNSDLVENTPMSKDEIAAIVKDEIASNNKLFVNKISDFDSSTKVRLTSIENGLKSKSIPTPEASSNLNNGDIEEYFKMAQNNQNQMLRDYLQSSSAQQQEYFKTMLVQFSDFMQEQRKEDLLMIQSNMVNLKENQDQQKEKTDQLLARILSTVNTQND